MFVRPDSGKVVTHPRRRNRQERALTRRNVELLRLNDQLVTTRQMQEAGDEALEQAAKEKKPAETLDSIAEEIASWQMTEKLVNRKIAKAKNEIGKLQRKLKITPEDSDA